MRIPDVYLAIDKRIYPCRGRVKLKQYNPDKPAKYELLYRRIYDSTVLIHILHYLMLVCSKVLISIM